MNRDRKIPKRVKRAYNRLKAMNIAVQWAEDFYNCDEMPHWWFRIMCEGDTDETTDNVDYYGNYWGSQKLQDILEEGGLYHEWENPAVTTVQDI